MHCGVKIMKKEEYLKSIARELAILSYEIKIRNTVNLYDINIVAEYFYQEFLRLVFGYDLVNLNTIQKNTSAIDLADNSRRIAIQVTSDNTSTKIHETIKKFNEKGLHNDYDRLIFVILTEKRKYTSVFDTEGLFSFDKNLDIIDCEDLMMHINNKNTTELVSITNFLDRELSDKVRMGKRKQASEIETIIAFIEYLSTNKKISEKKSETFIDPKEKIDRRFKKYAESLKMLYRQMVGLYEGSVRQAHVTLGLDEVKSHVISVYLMDISVDFLDKADGDPKKALDMLTIYFEEKISASGLEFDKMAIKYYLISETIKCNVFPNIVGDKIEVVS